MSAVRSRGNASTELALVKILRKEGITGWNRNKKVVGIRPDFIFLKPKIAVFVHGCFWHGCKKHGQMPSSNVKFWEEKITKNKIRDKRANATLKKSGWRVICFWEHQVGKTPISVIKKIKSVITIDN